MESRDYDLESELMNSKTICSKVLSDHVYATNLYRALSNMQWIKREVMPLLKNDTWSCSWRYAGGIVANIRGEGDYMDWYCSGGEGSVTPEILEDLYQLGWAPVPWDDDEL